MISDKKALESAKILINFCNEHVCQNCIFRKYGAEKWDCLIDTFELREVLSNIEAKKKNHGYID